MPPGQGARRADTDIAPTEPKAPSACEFLRRSGSVPTVGLSNIDAYERIRSECVMCCNQRDQVYSQI
jgi:hypothetical protein